jgi:transposase
VIAPQGLRNVGRLIAIIRDEEDARLPSLARQVLHVIATQIEQIEAAVTVLEKQTVKNTMGMVDVAFLAGITAGVFAAMTATSRRTRSAAISDNRSYRPAAQRYSTVMF